MNPSNNFSRRPKNFSGFRQSNSEMPREQHENVPVTSPSVNPPRLSLTGKSDSNFLISPYKMEKIQKALDIVYHIRWTESEWKNCLKCGTFTKKKCGGCSEAPYCCEECQNEDWKRHFEECENYVQSANFTSPNAELLSRQGARNFFPNQQNFDNHVDSTHTHHGDSRHQHNSESGVINKNQSRDNNNRVSNGYHNENEPAQRFNRNQNKRSPGGNFSQNSNRNEGYQSSSVPHNVEKESWDEKPKRDQTNQYAKKGGSPGKPNRNLNFDQSRQDNRRKGPGEWDKPSNCEPTTSGNENKSRNSELPTKKDIKPKREPVDNSFSSSEPKNVEVGNKASGSSVDKEIKIEKLVKPDIRTVFGITPCNENSYYVLAAADINTWPVLGQSLQEDAPKAKAVEPEIGLICACLSEDEWYRGKIVSVTPEIEFVALDFGPTWPCDKVEVPTRELPEELIKGPGMARLVKFTENLPKKEMEGVNFLIEVLETYEEYDVARYIGEAPTETVSETAPETTPEIATVKPLTPATTDLHLKEDIITSGSVVIISTSVGFNVCYVQRVDFGIEKLPEIEEKINKYAKTGEPFQNAELIKIGDVVCARFIDDGNFYRALVEYRNRNKFDVKFVDYGNLQKDTELKEIFPLPEELKSYPQLAVKVTLKGVTSSVDVKNERRQCMEAAEYFNDLSVKGVKLKLTYEDDMLKGVTLTEVATGGVVNEIINGKLNRK